MYFFSLVQKIYTEHSGTNTNSEFITGYQQGPFKCQQILMSSYSEIVRSTMLYPI